MNVKYYSGDRVYFRPLEPADVPRLALWVNDQANWRTLGRFAPISTLRERDYVENLYKGGDDVTFGIALHDGDQLIGCCGLKNVHLANRSAELGILIGDLAAQGQGYGAEATQLLVRYAFEELNLNRVSLEVFADNERGVNAYIRAGFIEEGRSRQAYFRNGRYHDVLHFGVLREDWAAAAEPAAAEARLSSMMT